MSRQGLMEKLSSALGDWLDASESPGLMPNEDIMVVLRAEDLLEAMGRLRWDSSLEFNVLMNHLGVDYGERFGLIYNLYSPTLSQKLTVKAYVPRHKPEAPSLEPVFRGINWYERETFDMFGIVFKRHSNLRRLLLPEDWEGYPLRKDYVYPESYGGLEHSRDDLLDSCGSKGGQDG